MSSTSPSQVKLREFILTDEQLFDAEERFPGIIRLYLATRNRARVLVEGHAWEFSLDEPSADNPVLLLVPRQWNRKESITPELWTLVWHKAAEAILAARVGHEEHRHHLKERRARAHLQAMPRHGVAAAAGEGPPDP
ncbi:MAG TPA: hypothetical protein VHD55_03445 [Candidatus Paceibacterota bacterium]|nr:hypothetical protein [Candidatus Paceibacterota bacterium]